MSTYIPELVQSIKSIHDADGDIKVGISCEDIQLNINQAVPCALILNEVVTNAFEHGFNGRTSGEINITLP